MQAHIRLGRLFGIQVGLHYSWFIIAALIALSLAATFSASHPEWSRALVWGLAVGTSVLFFVTLLLHELSHALVARYRGVPVRSIVLFALGGVAQMEREASDARTEFWMGIVGPITSAVIAALCVTSARLLGWAPAEAAATPAQAVLVWLGYINATVAMFNLVPGFPLDGGRVLRGIIWGRTGDAARATRIAATVGQVVAYALIAYGLLNLLAGMGFGGLWIAFIGWFLLESARETLARVQLDETLRNVSVGDVMLSDVPRLEAGQPVDDVVRRTLTPTGPRVFVVTRHGFDAGLITPTEVKEVEQPLWSQTPVSQIMKPFHDLPSVSPQTPVTTAIETMGRAEASEIPVVEQGRLVGVVTQEQVLDYLRRRAELHI